MLHARYQAMGTGFQLTGTNSVTILKTGLSSFTAMAKSTNLRFCLLGGDLEKDETSTRGGRSSRFNRV